MHKRTLIFGASLLALNLLAACGSKNEDEIPPAAGGGTGTSSAAPVDTSKNTATVSGKITFDGTPPPNDKVQMSSDPYCQMHAADYPTAETVEVKDGGLENVIIFVSSGVAPGSYPAPTTPVEIVQQNCHYVPHVFTIMTNQTLNVKNGDMTLHNIHVWAEKNPTFNVGQPVQGMVSPT